VKDIINGVWYQHCEKRLEQQKVVQKLMFACRRNLGIGTITVLFNRCSVKHVVRFREF